MYHYSIHSRTHPPGPVIFLYFVKCLFGGGVATAAWSAVIVTATAVVPFYLLARDLAGERVARVAAAIYAVVPSLVLFGATSMDGVFLVPLMWSMYFMRRVVARPNIRNAIGAGIALAVSLMLSYVTVCVGTMMVLYAIMEVSVDAKRIWRVAGAYAISAGVIVLSLWLINVTSGFNYLKCFEASRYFDHYLMRTFHISFGRYLDISFSNLVAFLIGVGLPVVVLWWKKIWKWDRFVTAGTIAVIGFSFAKLFTRETERIWLFFAPVAVLGAASCIGRLGSSQRRVLEWVMGLLFAQVWLFQVFLYTIW
jgi:4-amino-4-deoxy-L-arabinose transferase-like glycosyltransferase